MPTMAYKPPDPGRTGRHVAMSSPLLRSVRAGRAQFAVEPDLRNPATDGRDLPSGYLSHSHGKIHHAINR